MERRTAHSTESCRRRRKREREQGGDIAICLHISVIRPNYKLGNLFRLFRVCLPAGELDDILFHLMFAQQLTIRKKKSKWCHCRPSHCCILCRLCICHELTIQTERIYHKRNFDIFKPDIHV